MPKIAKPLTALEVKRLSEPTWHAVGTIPGLGLDIKKSGAKSWVLVTTMGARRPEFGLGGYPGVTLAQAIERARKVRDDIRAGIDPRAESRAARTTIEWTFKKTAGAYIDTHRAGWKNAKHAEQWANTLATYAYPHFGDKHVRDVNKGDVLAAIGAIWTTKSETARRVRNRIELVLNYAVQRELRPEGLNPARWRGNLDAALPKATKVAAVEHHEALPIDGMHAFMKQLRQAEGMGAKALQFVVLTAARSGEVRGAAWNEIDLQEAVWSIPAARMKSGRPHRVPLSERALELLEALPRFEGTDLVFAGQGDKPLSDMTLVAVMRRMGLTAVPHGFRSSFRDWAAERTNMPAEVAEMALSHIVGDATEAAYRRGDLFDKRRELMTLWAAFIDTPPPTGNVRAIRGKGAA
jgi:integrase